MVVPEPKYPSPVRNYIGGPLLIAKALRQSRARLIHATDPQQPWGGRAGSSIITVYDLIPLADPEILRSWRPDYRALYAAYLRRVRAAANVVAISYATARDVEERLGVSSARIDVVYPVVAVPTRAPRMEPAEPTFLVVGALDRHKQPELALEALSIFVARWGAGRVRFIGPTEPSERDRIRQFAERLGVAERISIEGRISDAALEDAFDAATALLAMSRIEGFGLPPVEAILRGVPVVAVRTPASLETLGGVATLVPADAEAIALAMESPADPPEASVNALRRRFSLESAAASLGAVYRKLLA